MLWQTYNMATEEHMEKNDWFQRFRKPLENSIIFEKIHQNVHICTEWKIIQQIYKSVVNGVVGERQKYKKITAMCQEAGINARLAATRQGMMAASQLVWWAYHHHSEPDNQNIL